MVLGRNTSTARVKPTGAASFDSSGGTKWRRDAVVDASTINAPTQPNVVGQVYY